MYNSLNFQTMKFGSRSFTYLSTFLHPTLKISQAGLQHLLSEFVVTFEINQSNCTSSNRLYFGSPYRIFCCCNQHQQPPPPTLTSIVQSFQSFRGIQVLAFKPICVGMLIILLLLNELSINKLKTELVSNYDYLKKLVYENLYWTLHWCDLNIKAELMTANSK